MTTARAASGPLAGLRVVDLTDERGIYGAKLLADLGADVVRVEPPGGDPLRQRLPRLEDSPGAGESLWYAFFGSNRRSIEIDLGSSEGREQLLALIRKRADAVLDCGTLEAMRDEFEALRSERPELVSVDVSSFGPDGPWKDYLAPDLVAGALGGTVATTGDADTPPLNAFGELNFMVSGIYAAIATLAALRHAARNGVGQRGDVSTHECIASCLEHVFMWYWYGERIPTCDGPVLPRQGSLHWSRSYVVLNGGNGAISVTPWPDPQAQLMWLVENDAHQDLLDPKWQEPGMLPKFLIRFLEVLGEWLPSQDVRELFLEAQQRHAPYGAVLPVDAVAENPQLKARDWWVPYQVGGREVSGPGAPYALGDTPWSIGPSSEVGADTASLLAEIGWD